MKLFIALFWTIFILTITSFLNYHIFLNAYTTPEAGLMMAQTYGIAFNCVQWLAFFVPILWVFYRLETTEQKRK
jgi:hypothetical protein